MEMFIHTNTDLVIKNTATSHFSNVSLTELFTFTDYTYVMVGPFISVYILICFLLFRA